LITRKEAKLGITKALEFTGAMTRRIIVFLL
jgi:hypothetical protein